MGYNNFTMIRKLISTGLLVFLLTATILNLTPPRAVLAAPSAYDLIEAVQALRRSKGLAPLIVDSALMSSAQGHSNYQASIGTWSHVGAGGTRAVDRARAAGFGGGATVYISENVAISNNKTGLDVVIYQYWGDPDHWKTMTSPLYINAGAGVTEKNGVVYYTLNTGYLAGQAGSGSQATSPAGAPKVAATSPPTTPLPTVPLIVPIKTSTPNPDGSVVHPVGYGQAMISIATAYGMKLDDLRKINNWTSSSVLWAGQKLLIQPSFTPTRSPTATLTSPPPTRTSTPTRIPSAMPTDTPTPTETTTVTSAPVIPPVNPLEPLDRRNLGTVIIAICGFGLLVVVVTQIRKKS